MLRAEADSAERIAPASGPLAPVTVTLFTETSGESLNHSQAPPRTRHVLKMATRVSRPRREASTARASAVTRLPDPPRGPNRRPRAPGRQIRGPVRQLRMACELRFTRSFSRRLPEVKFDSRR